MMDCNSRITKYDRKMKAKHRYAPIGNRHNNRINRRIGKKSAKFAIKSRNDSLKKFDFCVDNSPYVDKKQEEEDSYYWQVNQRLQLHAQRAWQWIEFSEFLEQQKYDQEQITKRQQEETKCNYRCSKHRCKNCEWDEPTHFSDSYIDDDCIREHHCSHGTLYNDY